MNTETAEAPTVVATLAMSGISKSFGGVAALTDVSLEVLPGEVHALLGENGAGKSTLMNVATGTIRPTPEPWCSRAVDRHPRPSRSGAPGHRLRAPAPCCDARSDGVREPARRASAVGASRGAVTRGDGPRAPGARRPAASISPIASRPCPSRGSICSRSPRRSRSTRRSLSWTSRPPRWARTRSNCCSGLSGSGGPGTSVVYITHRLAEVRELADRVTVLRDGPFGPPRCGRDLGRANCSR